MRPSRLDVTLALATVAGTAAEVLPGDNNRPAVQIAFGAIVGASLLVRRAHPEVPMLVLTVCFTAFAVSGIEPDAVAPIIAFWLAVYTVGLRLSVRRAVVLYAMVIAGLAAELVQGGTLGDVIFTSIFFIVPPFLLGRLMRARHEQIDALERANAELQRERTTAARLAGEAERARIAHELHDGLSHGLGVLSLQAAAGVRLAVSDPEQAAAALAAIRDAAGRAMDELAIADPRPADLSGVGDLVAGVRAAGVAVTLEQTGDAPVPAGVGVAAHRIVQEALTNALRHSDPARVDVRVHRGGEAVELRVEHDGATDGGTVSPGSGRGLAGMRERARTYGGSIDAGPCGHEGYRVSARLPTGPS